MTVGTGVRPETLTTRSPHIVDENTGTSGQGVDIVQAGGDARLERIPRIAGLDDLGLLGETLHAEASSIVRREGYNKFACFLGLLNHIYVLNLARPHSIDTRAERVAVVLGGLGCRALKDHHPRVSETLWFDGLGNPFLALAHRDLAALKGHLLLGGVSLQVLAALRRKEGEQCGCASPIRVSLNMPGGKLAKWASDLELG